MFTSSSRPRSRPTPAIASLPKSHRCWTKNGARCCATSAPATRCGSRWTCWARRLVADCSRRSSAATSSAISTLSTIRIMPSRSWPGRSTTATTGCTSIPGPVSPRALRAKIPSPWCAIRSCRITASMPRLRRTFRSTRSRA